MNGPGRRRWSEDDDYHVLLGVVVLTLCLTAVSLADRVERIRADARIMSLVTPPPAPRIERGHDTAWGP